MSVSEILTNVSLDKYDREYILKLERLLKFTLENDLKSRAEIEKRLSFFYNLIMNHERTN